MGAFALTVASGIDLRDPAAETKLGCEILGKRGAVDELLRLLDITIGL